MDVEKLEKLARMVLEELKPYSTDFGYYPQLEASFKNLMQIANKTLPEHNELFSVAYKAIGRDVSAISIDEAKMVISHLLDIIELEKSTNIKIKEMRIFEGAEEKLKQAGLSFRKDDYVSSFHNLNTALELVLKDRLGIPSTITNVNTSNIIDVLTKHKVGPYLYLEEVRRHVLVIDNKTKHQGYCPSKIDCINGIKAMEELVAKLRNVNLKLTEEVKNKIYEGI